MNQHHVRLSSAELGSLWGTYIQTSMSVLLTRYFSHRLQDGEIKALLLKSLQRSQNNMITIQSIFNAEQIPLPIGFTDDDLNLGTPALFTDPFSLSYLYNMSRFELITYSFAMLNIARSDVLDFFTQALGTSTNIYKEAVELLLEKGMYDRPPMIPYPTHVEFIEKQSYISARLLGKKRPLNAAELTELFFNIERNYFGILLTMGLLQVVQDKELKDCIDRGKRICEKQVTLFNDILKKEDLLGMTSVNVEVTASTLSPFSDKLTMGLMQMLNSLDVILIGHALSVSQRADLVGHYGKLIAEILVYSEDVFNIMVNRGWIEQPPMAINRKELMKS